MSIKIDEKVEIIDKQNDGTNTDNITDKRIANLNPAWVKGQSGNPLGRPKQDSVFKQLAVENSIEALETCISIMRSTKARNQDRLAAITIVLDRAYGKPIQAIDGGTDENGRKPITMEHIISLLGGSK